MPLGCQQSPLVLWKPESYWRTAWFLGTRVRAARAGRHAEGLARLVCQDARMPALEGSAGKAELSVPERGEHLDQKWQITSLPLLPTP